MTTTPESTDIRRLLEEQGSDVPMLETTDVIHSALLHRDRDRLSRSLIVSFPPGFRQLAAVQYPTAEEFYLINGDLTMAGQKFVRGDWVRIEAGVPRNTLISDDGALTYAWFGGRVEPTVAPGAGDEPLQHQLIRVHDAPPLAFSTNGYEIDNSAVPAPGTVIDRPAAILTLDDLRWAVVGVDAPYTIGPGVTLLRWIGEGTWS